MKKNLIIIGLVVVTLSRYVLGQNVWTVRNPLPTIEDLNGIAFGNGAFVAVGARGTIVSSSNGVIWTNRGSTTAQDLYSIIFADNRFVAGGSGGAVLTSSDGISWTTSSSGTQEDIISISYGKNLFVAVSWSIMGRCQILYYSMPRKARINNPGLAHHIMARTFNDLMLFREKKTGLFIFLVYHIESLKPDLFVMPGY